MLDKAALPDADTLYAEVAATYAAALERLVTGLSVSNANTPIHRIKSTLARFFSERAKP